MVFWNSLLYMRATMHYYIHSWDLQDKDMLEENTLQIQLLLLM
jgi:hypothetical protein